MGWFLLICLYGLIQFNEPPDCIMRGLPWAVSEGQVCLWDAGADVYPSFSWTKKKEKDKEGEMGIVSLPLTVNSKSLRAKSLSVLVLDTSW